MRAEFVSVDSRQLFTLQLEPVGSEPIASILFLAPLAEEMNKSRRAVAEQAKALAGAGYSVTLLDLTGCGDSSGMFVDARWGTWKDDVGCFVDSLSQQGTGRVILWGVRFGCLLACEVAQERDAVSGVLLWQPALNGEQHLDQFLRFEIAGQALKGEAGFDRASLWNELRSGRSLDVAGYELSSELALAIANVRLGNLTPACPVAWMDIGTRAQDSPGVACRTVIDRWTEQGIEVQWSGTQSDAFWRNIDARENTTLQSATLNAVSAL